MARIRTIKPQFFTSEDVTALEPLARLLFIGLFTECDRDGRVEDRPRTLKMRLLPEDQCDIDALLWSLVDGGLIRRYEADGLQIIQVSGFQKHQKPHPKEPVSILPADGVDRQKPWKKTAETTQSSIHPVENPSSPVGREGKEYGVQGREGVSAHTRQPMQGRGANEPGSLPRDHMRHVVCGPSMRFCLSEFEYSTLARALNHPDAGETRKAITAFVDLTESSPGAIGKFSEVETKFTAWLKSTGRLKTPEAVKPPPIRIQDILDREAAKKAAR